MGTILSKKQMSEEDIKLQYITPAITSKWNREKITMETRITDGKINLKGNFVFREKPKRADYILYLSANNPIAIVKQKIIPIVFRMVYNRQLLMQGCWIFLLPIVLMGMDLQSMISLPVRNESLAWMSSRQNRNLLSVIKKSLVLRRSRRSLLSSLIIPARIPIRHVIIKELP